MRNLLGTHLGHSCIESMCELLQNKSITEYSVLRSAVFFIGMGLWGTKCVQALVYKPQSVLPSFKCALESGNPMLAFEVSLTSKRLVEKFGHELPVCAWDYILTIVSMLLIIVKSNAKSEQIVSLKQNAHELLTIIEKLHHTQVYNGSSDDLFCIVEEHLRSRPTDSVMLLVTYRSQSINPAKFNWINNLNDFISTYYFSLTNIKVRLKILDLVESIILNNMDAYEKELLDNVILAKFQNLSQEQNYAIQESLVKFLLNVSFCSRSQRCIAVLQILKPIVDVSVSFDEQNASVIPVMETAVNGLAKLFLMKFNGELGSHAVEAFRLMLCFIESYYQNQELQKHPSVFKEVRQKALNMFFEIRCNVNLQLSLVSKPHLNSNIISLNYKELADVKSSESVLPYQRAFTCFCQCIKKENFWPILETTITCICELLDNKCLILSIDPLEIDELAQALTGLISNSSRVLTFSGAPPTFKRPALMACGLKAITVVVSFHAHMTITRQRKVLRCLEAGFSSKCAKHCIAALTQCVIEMKSEALLRNLPSILLRLSQMSAIVPLATSVLELLSTLSQLPNLYSNFVDDQYMSVFKIALQHADPEKFSLYVVSLAHHVINMWFIKCRLAFRPDFVRYITLSLQNTCHTASDNSLQHNLIEACIDVMARYTFSNTMPMTKRPVMPKDMSKHSRSSTWLVGNRLITISTNFNSTKEFSQHADVSDTATNMPTFPDNAGSDKKVSVEAPGKLQSSDEMSIKSTRQRHKSSGAVLRQPSLEIEETTLCSSCDKRLYSDDERGKECSVADVGSTWAEIFIRRPSGNSSWLLNSHQLSLMINSNKMLGSSMAQLNFLSHSTSDLSQQDELDGTSESWTSRDEVAPTRQRSRTVSSSHDFVIDAATRAKAKAREQQMSVMQVPASQPAARIMPNKVGEKQPQVLTPEYVFLQLFHSSLAVDGLQKPLLLPNSATVERSVSVLDLIPPYDTWSTGVVYVRPGQSDDGKGILNNQHGSVRYQNLLGSLGNLVSLSDCDSSMTHLGGLDCSEGEDGDATYVWQENVMQMVFHVATLMPNLESGVSNKQRHIGNDYVTIIYDDNLPGNYVAGSIVKGQFLSVEIVISPLDLGYNLVQLVYHKPELKTVLDLEDKYTVSDDRLGLLVRQMALHASMASAAHHLKTPEKFVSKPLSRLKQIKHIRSRALQELAWKDEDKSKRYNTSSDLYELDDFSDFVS